MLDDDIQEKLQALCDKWPVFREEQLQTLLPIQPAVRGPLPPRHDPARGSRVCVCVLGGRGNDFLILCDHGRSWAAHAFSQVLLAGSAIFKAISLIKRACWLQKVPISSAVFFLRVVGLYLTSEDRSTTSSYSCHKAIGTC